MATSLPSKTLGPVPCLAPLPGLAPMPGLGMEEIASQNRSLKRKSKELDSRMSTLDGVVAQLSNDSLVVHSELETMRSRLELLEKVFMFVNFEELQKVVTKLVKQTAGQDTDGSSPRMTGPQQVDKIVNAEIVTANLVEHFPNCSVLSSSSESLHAAAAAAVKSSSSESLEAAAGVLKKTTPKLSRKASREDADTNANEAAVNKPASPAKLGSKGQMAASGVVRAGSALQADTDIQEAEEQELRRPLSRSSVVDDDGTESKLRRPRHKAQALRGMMAAKIPATAPCADRPSSRTRHGEYFSNVSTTGADGPSLIQFQPRSKCFTFATEFRQRNGPDSILPSFIFERLGQEGMTEDEINNIGRGPSDQRPINGADGPLV